jgi:predicted GNAT family acetyltransferase
MAAAVRDNAEQRRYEIVVGGEPAGFLEYRLDGEVADFVHTETLPGHEGEGIGSQLVHDALLDARSRGWQVRPSCPFVRSYLTRHPELRELVPADERRRFGLAD